MTINVVMFFHSHLDRDRDHNLRLRPPYHAQLPLPPNPRSEALVRLPHTKHRVHRRL